MIHCLATFLQLKQLALSQALCDSMESRPNAPHSDSFTSLTRRAHQVRGVGYLLRALRRGFSRQHLPQLPLHIFGSSMQC